MNIGFIGLGIMGQPMAANLLAAGYSLTVYNRAPGRDKQLVKDGAERTDDIRKLAKASDVVIAMVPDHEAVDAILFGVRGIIRELEGKIFVNMSTVLPEYSKKLGRKLKLKGVDFVDAPVSGSRQPAEAGELVILAAGQDETLKLLDPIFSVLGKKTIHCGDPGQGSMMKVAVNLLAGVMMEGLSEAVRFGIEGNLKRDSIFEAILSGPMSCEIFSDKKDMFLRGKFPGQFPFRQMSKDLNLVSETAEKLATDFPCATAAGIQYNHGMSEGLGDEDFAAVFKLL
ncbi:NAD(P)-dependent oxidoreductase [Salidesulfovibrio onnuriiensis]|uniref:NAD(P)-dependent oxidoreductase n=1 Tax=Salidesulfovibrio onnuriiensis TaxID=2583823 RepID=UPI0011CC85B5|nr:NAD(P)-dependent oxidoreductase [Salidesulfovibrio onnuriiensis]